jgi:hypothetical protein
MASERGHHGCAPGDLDAGLIFACGLLRSSEVLRRDVAVANPVRLHDHVSYPLSGVLDRPVGFLVVLEVLWFRTADPRYWRLLRFWTTVFALSVGMGVVSAIVLPMNSAPTGAG